MNRDAVLEGLLSFAEDDWLPLWVISEDAAELLQTENPEELLEATIDLSKALLERGLLAGEVPLESGMHFRAWSNQSPAFVAAAIRTLWQERNGAPDWGDGPWFALPLA